MWFSHREELCKNRKKSGFNVALDCLREIISLRMVAVEKEGYRIDREPQYIILCYRQVPGSTVV